MHTPLVSIITINYNQVGFTLELLASLQQVDYPNLEIIVVDNGSKENPSSIIKGRYPHVNVIRSEENLGFAGGNNLGIKASSGEYIFLLNNDTEVKANAIAALVSFLEKTPEAGIACPKIIYHNSGNRIQYVGCEAINPFTGRNHREGFREVDTGKYDAIRSTALPHGAAMMIPRNVIDKVGLMPEIFFLYYEELDWAETIKNAGYKIYVVPEAVVYHKESMSIGKNSPLKTYYMTRNRLLYMRRHTKGFRKASWIVFFACFSIPKNSLMYLINREPEHLKAFWKGVVWNLRTTEITEDANRN